MCIFSVKSQNAECNSKCHATLEPCPKRNFLYLFLNNNRGEALGVLDVHSLNVAVKLLLGTLLVVSLSGNSHADSVVDTLDTLLPDLLVELGVDADIGGTLK